ALLALRAAAGRTAAPLRRPDAGQFRQLCLEVGALFAYLFAEHALELFDVLAELADLHFIGGFRTRWPASSLGFLVHDQPFRFSDCAVKPAFGRARSMRRAPADDTQDHQTINQRVLAAPS